MPAIGGPNITEDGLVFAYDLGNVRSYKGEPTTNILNDNILQQGSGVSLGEDAVGKFIQLGDFTSGYGGFRLPNIPVSSNDTYTWSFELMSLEGIEPTNQMHFDTNEYSDQYPNSNDLSRASAIHRRPNSLVAGEWTPFSLTVTMKDGLTGANTWDYMNFRYPVFRNKRIYYRNIQFEFKDHPTQYAGQGATRSNTEGLIDLINNTPVNLSNVSFDEDAQMTFDGSNDYIDLGDNSLFDFSNGIMTIEAIINLPSSWTGGSKYPNIVSKGAAAGWDTDGWALFGFRDWPSPGQKSWGLGIRNGATNRTVYIADRATDVYLHVVAVLDGSTMRLYENGAQVKTNTQTINPASNNTSVRIGRDPNSNYFPGEVPYVKAYNRALSPEQIAQNFNSLKNRFNL